MKTTKKLFAAAALALLAAPSFGADCSIPGQQDVTCLSPITHSALSKPICSAGQITVTPATWNGSSWASPVCQTPIPPKPTSAACQFGFASGPAWTGSTWTYTCAAPTCVPGNAPPDYAVGSSTSNLVGTNQGQTTSSGGGIRCVSPNQVQFFDCTSGYSIVSGTYDGFGSSCIYSPVFNLGQSYSWSSDGTGFLVTCAGGVCNGSMGSGYMVYRSQFGPGYYVSTWSAAMRYVY